MKRRCTRTAPVAACHALALLAVGGLLAVASDATAGQGPRTRPATASRAVSVRDLDLATTDGLSSAEQRVTRTAQQLCLRLSDSRRIDARQIYAECVVQARDQAWQRLLVQVFGSRRMATSLTNSH